MQKNTNTVTLDVGGAQLTVATNELFRAWMEKHFPAEDALIEIGATLAFSNAAPPAREGERYVGTILGADGHGHQIFRMPYEPSKKLDWEAALKYAKDNGGDLPDRVEGALLHASQVEGEFDKAEWYWTREQHAGDDAYAWCQHFAHGIQISTHKDDELRVVLVRSVAI